VLPAPALTHFHDDESELCATRTIVFSSAGTVVPVMNPSG
jgi:hypothetical protein